jgi:cytoskeletal protein RodZ
MTDNLARVSTEKIAKLQEIGSNLRQLRQDNALSIEEIAERTRIQPRLIRALEEGQFDILPEPVYIQGIIKKYGESLGVNGLELAKSMPASEMQISPTRKKSWTGGLGAPQIRPIHLYGVYVLLILGSISALSHSLNSSIYGNGSVMAGQDSSQATTVASTAAASGIASGAPVELEISAKTNSWVKVVVDGKKEFEGTLTAGKAQSWVAKRELILTTANAGGLVVTQNNQQLGELGAPGQKRQVKFQAKS